MIIFTEEDLDPCRKPIIQGRDHIGPIQFFIYHLLQIMVAVLSQLRRHCSVCSFCSFEIFSTRIAICKQKVLNATKPKIPLGIYKSNGMRNEKKNTTDHYIKNSQSKIQKRKAYKTKIRKKISSFKTTTIMPSKTKNRWTFK